MNPLKWFFAMLWFAIGPRYFGGDSESQTQTTTQNYDQRQVVTNTTSNLDLSNRSTNNTVLDFSDRSADTTNTTTNTTNITQTLDGGAIGAMRDVALGSMQYGDGLFDTATLFANNALNSSLAASQSAFTTAAGLQKDALVGANDAFSKASKAAADAYANSDRSTKTAYATALEGASAAYADAKGTTNAQKSIIMGVLAVAGLMALAFMQKRAG